jgi:hypothetical protein
MVFGFNCFGVRILLRKLAVLAFLICIIFTGFNLSPVYAIGGATLSAGPASGTYTVGSTFTVSIFVNTGGNNINAFQADLEFPADKLQVVSPSAGKSIVGVWVVQPTYDNRLGLLKFQGGVPSPGVNTSEGLISQVTFRVTSIGTAIIKFRDSSQVLLNDGKGTDILGQTSAGFYHLILPPPAGPLVSSPTHPDSEKWYANNTVAFEWQGYSVTHGYSYALSDDPSYAPDNISQGAKASVLYRNLKDGIHYFHIKALRDNVWGGITHFAVKIDTTPPADFPIEITPGVKSVIKRPTIDFKTTDGLSGIDYYEIKIISLTPSGDENSAQNFFIEVNPPYIPELDIGDYDIVIRAYDRAGNYVQGIERLKVVNRAFDIVRGEGIKIRSNIVISWIWFWIIMSVLLLVAGYAAWFFWERHGSMKLRVVNGELPPGVRRQLEELKSLKEKYKKPALTALIAIFMTGMIMSGGIARAQTALANQASTVAPPITTLFSKSISNEEVFYIGGKTEISNGQVAIYIQGLRTGETLIESAVSDKNGDWFYTHPTFLSSGEYLVWTQVKIGDEVSPPSPQAKLTVSQTALQIGASRLSYETLYLGMVIILFAVIAGLVIAAVYHYREARRKHLKLIDNVKRIEESIRRGFALLHRDINAELTFIQKAKLSRELSIEEKSLEDKILKDLDSVQTYIGREVWEIEKEA